MTLTSRVLTISLLAMACPNLQAGDAPLPWQRGTYDPDWAEVAPRQTKRVTYNLAVSETANGESLLRAFATLVPGDRLEVEAGRYVIAPKASLNLQGSANAPIWIVAADPDHPPVITRPDARQNLLNVGENKPCRYLALQNLELTGGSVIIRFYDCANVWLDRCELHHGQHGGITVNSRDTSFMYITRNHLHDFPSGTGEAMYLGANNSKVRMSYSVIAANHVHDCGGDQGDGIELKQGSFNNWLVENHIHDTHYPCLIAYGTDGKGVNVIERNVCYRSGDNTMQVQGEAIVRDNVIMAGRGAGFASTDHQGKTRMLHVVNNTIITAGRGVNLSSWNGREGMVLANNAIYSRDEAAVRFPNGAAGVTVRGNVVLGAVQGVSGGTTNGRGLEDFVSVAWDGSRRDVTPARGSALIGRADPEFTTPTDLHG
ncbi:MAG: right-handed parallel beta-helix repeat-containing protein, partial [Planctomycetes bacterium]|nr:right-handed parallel beta-helix repeat-containing protein [Planctomycetota bacterium]